jgi:uncharacterized protein (TIGR02646 family)
MKRSKGLHKFQNLDRTIRYTKNWIEFIESLQPFQGNEWDKPLTNTGRPRGAQERRNELKNFIRAKLRNIQFPHCIYCGLHEEIVGNLQRDHIAPKEQYNEYLFEAENLVLACAGCNGFLKKNNYDTISVYVPNNYDRCTFKIVHPYRDDFRDHLEGKFADNRVIISAKKYSRKGKNTILLFGLDEPRQADFRGASLMQKHLRLTRAQEAQMQLITRREYRSN